MMFIFFNSVVDAIFDLPLSYYKEFVAEKEFNKKTVKLWIKDMLVSGLILIIIGPAILYLCLYIIYSTGELFFVWAAIAFTTYVVFFAIVGPIFIRPLVMKQVPMEDNLLRRDLE